MVTLMHHGTFDPEKDLAIVKKSAFKETVSRDFRPFVLAPNTLPHYVRVVKNDVDIVSA